MSRFKVGDKITHDTFGEGIIIKSPDWYQSDLHQVKWIKGGISCEYAKFLKPWEPDIEEAIVDLGKGFEPEHYTDGDIECVDYLFDNLPLEAFIGGLEWNTKKYLHRWRHKGNPVGDLKKARDYLTVWIDVMEGKDPEFKEWKNEKD